MPSTFDHAARCLHGAYTLTSLVATPRPLDAFSRHLRATSDRTGDPFAHGVAWGALQCVVKNPAYGLPPLDRSITVGQLARAVTWAAAMIDVQGRLAAASVARVV